MAAVAATTDTSPHSGAPDAPRVARRSGRSAVDCSPAGSGGSATTPVHRGSARSTVATRCSTSVWRKVRSGTLRGHPPSQWEPSGSASAPHRHSRAEACGAGAIPTHSRTAATISAPVMAPPSGPPHGSRFSHSPEPWPQQAAQRARAASDSGAHMPRAAARCAACASCRCVSRVGAASIAPQLSGTPPRARSRPAAGMLAVSRGGGKDRRRSVLGGATDSKGEPPGDPVVAGVALATHAARHACRRGSNGPHKPPSAAKAARESGEATPTGAAARGGTRVVGVGAAAFPAGAGHALVPPHSAGGAPPPPPAVVGGAALSAGRPGAVTAGSADSARTSSRSAGAGRSSARNVANHDATWAADATTERSPSPSPPMRTGRAARATSARRVPRRSSSARRRRSSARRIVASTPSASAVAAAGGRHRSAYVTSGAAHMRSSSSCACTASGGREATARTTFACAAAIWSTSASTNSAPPTGIPK